MTKENCIITSEESAKISHVYGADKYGFIGLVITLGYYLPNIFYQWFNPSEAGFWQKQYEYVYYDLFGGNELYIISIGAVIVHLVAYWSLGILFIIIDLTEKPAFIYKYKIKDEKYHAVTYSELLSLIKRCLFNQIFVSIPFATAGYFTLKWVGCPFSISEVPSWTTSVLHVSIHFTTFEIVYYYAHRFLHLPIVYKHIHKKHHEWTSPVSITSFYVHPIDQLLSVYLPVLSGIFFTRCHAITLLLWVYLGITLGVLEHIGYKIPLYPSPELHTLHHQTFTEFYGATEVLDYLHKTNNVKKNVKPPG